METGTPTTDSARGAVQDEVTSMTGIRPVGDVAAVRVETSSFTVAEVRGAMVRLNGGRVAPGVVMFVLALWFVLASMHMSEAVRLAAIAALLLFFAWKVAIQLPRRQVASVPPGSWTISADGVRVEQPGQEALLGWASFARVRLTPGYLMLHQEGRAVMFVPVCRLTAGAADRVGAIAAAAGVATEGFPAPGH